MEGGDRREEGERERREEDEEGRARIAIHSMLDKYKRKEDICVAC